MWDTDQWLVKRAVRGDHAAFGRLFDRHSPVVFHLLRRLTGSAAEAEDLTQETFVAAYQALPTWQRRGKFSTWIGGIAVRRYRDSRRRAPSTEALSEEMPDSVAERDPFQHCSRREAERALEAGIAALPEPYREAFVLIRVEGWSYKDAATELGVPVGTVQSRLWRATQQLQTALAAILLPEASLCAGPVPPREGANHVV